MSEPNAKWKTKLLSSSVPLEYEVANLLVSRAFAVDSDFSYSRIDGATVKDFSVDIKATTYLPHGEDLDIESQLMLLVECKHRHDQVSWLFFRDPNRPDFSPFTLGQTLRAVDNFSEVLLDPNCTVPFDEDSIMCFKAVEVDLSKGGVHDSEIRHGIAQLQYALPQLMVNSIRLVGEPFFFCPILVTTADLLVADVETSMQSVRTADDLGDFATSVPYVVVNVDPSPGFDRHRAAACAGLLDGLTYSDILTHIPTRKALGARGHAMPHRLAKRLTDPAAVLRQYFGQYVVCSFEGLPTLVDALVAISTAATTTASRLPSAP